MLKLLVQDENGLIKTRNGEPELSCDADELANAAIDFLAAIIGTDLNEIVSDYNKMHEMIEAGCERHRQTIQEACRRLQRIAGNFSALPGADPRPSETGYITQKRKRKIAEMRHSER